LHVNQQILKTFCLLQVTDFFDTFLLELELELEPEPEPEPPKLKSLESRSRQNGRLRQHCFQLVNCTVKL